MPFDNDPDFAFELCRRQFDYDMATDMSRAINAIAEKRNPTYAALVASIAGATAFYLIAISTEPDCSPEKKIKGIEDMLTVFKLLFDDAAHCMLTTLIEVGADGLAAKLRESKTKT